MSRKWFYKTADGEAGPIPENELRQRAIAGQLSPADQIRTEGSQLWRPLRQLMGIDPDELSTTGLASEIETASRSHDLRHRAPERSRWQKPPSSRVVVVLLGVAVLGGVAAFAGWWANRPPLFPKPVSLAVVEVSESRAMARRRAVLGRRPVVPSIPGLELGVPRIIPGFEDVSPAFSPSLSHDLKTIVFAGQDQTSGGFDLFIATRTSVTKPFEEPQAMESCRSRELDAYPALSPDGLEIIFVRGSQSPQLMYSSRVSTRFDFDVPTAWNIPEMNPANWQVGYPQFVDQNCVSFCRKGATLSEREYVITERSDRQSPFEAPQVTPFADSTPPYSIADNRIHAYFGWPKGLNYSVRVQPESEFVPSQPLIAAETTGSIDGQIWVAPKEDVVFYCSAGPQHGEGTQRKLWMIHF